MVICKDDWFCHQPLTHNELAPLNDHPLAQNSLGRICRGIHRLLGLLEGTGDRKDPLGEFVAPLLSIDPEQSGSATDLQTLRAWLGDARVVGLGESEHGVDDFHRLAHRLFADLAEQAVFEVFALEIDPAHAHLLDRWVRGGEGDLDELIARHAWPNKVFYRRGLRELLLWMREYNRKASRPLRLAGFDCKDPRLAMTTVVELLARIDPAAAKRATTTYARHRDLQGLGVIPNLSGFSATLDIALPTGRQHSEILRIGLEARADGFTWGSGGLWASSDASWTFDQLTDDWHRWWLEIEVPESVEGQQVTFYHRGNGTVWLRDPRVQLGDWTLALSACSPSPVSCTTSIASRPARCAPTLPSCSRRSFATRDPWNKP